MIRGNPVQTLFVKATIWLSIVFGQSFNHSIVMPVPDLSFHPSIFYGLDVLEQMDFKPLYGKTIGVFTNQTAVNRQGTHLLDLLKAHPKIDVEIIFTPQYGLFAQQNERFKIQGDQKFDPIYNARIVEVFGRNVKPPEWAMRGLDLILIDIQDTGVRYSTYVATTTKIMEVASEWNTPVILLDRPNPLRGDRVDGPVVRPQFQSFEGYHLVPIRHGMTIGEMAIMANEMGWIKNLKRVNLTVIPMANWKRAYWLDKSEHPWVKPQPKIKSLRTNLAYVGFGLLEGTNLNDGRGTSRPYMRAGAPWLSGSHLVEKLSALNLPGVEFRIVEYIPRKRPEDRMVPMHVNKVCSGVDIYITDANRYDPLATATAIMVLAYQLYPRQFQWDGLNRIDMLYGHSQLRIFAAQGKPANYLPPLWLKDVLKFNEFRQQFLLYQ
ncbi:MAG: DUF1343 domain-containing protein [Candidatus Marinimicrobia bacterium]|mgnify:FL=1|jgi:uncharacterized protein YbbC (DUF1343 family)|nr:DUF1343 domain-containing protein [Candidatus Neomarinimicrobiota bacterium]MDD9930388.1 DUF1343 domain-containing protein [Candidatus Neomarinimicrobiota bacterium]MDP6991369.1 DUF1343 domain-containing protein [Candidatus Neomarinimicrobiota bacterium]